MAIRYTYEKVGERFTIRARKRDGTIVGQKVDLLRATMWDTNKYAPAWMRPEIDETLEGEGLFDKAVKKLFSKFPKQHRQRW